MQHWQPGQPLKLTTGRFVLRSLLPRDATPAYVSWWNDADIQRGFNYMPRKWGIPRAREHINTFDNRHRFHLGIFTRDTGKFIGFYSIIFKPRPKLATGNICIGDTDHRGLDSAKEISLAIMAFAYGTLDAAKCSAIIKGINLASITLTRQLGLKREGRLRKHAIGVNGKLIDVFHYGLLREEWESRDDTDGLLASEPEVYEPITAVK